MKTAKLITALTLMHVMMWTSISTFANRSERNTGDGPKSTEKKVDSAEKRSNSETTSPKTSENEFNYLRFDVSKFIDKNETEITELPLTNEFDYLRFDVSKFIDKNETGITELPLTNESDYLRFDVNKYSATSTGEIDELPDPE